MSPALKNIQQLGKRLGIAFLAFTIARIIFALVNLSHFPNVGFSSFLYGLRFDMVAISYLFAPFILLHLIPVKNYGVKWRQNGLKFLFHLGNTLGLLFNLIDVIYFNFVFKRSTFDLFSLVGTGNDTLRLIPQFLKDFWYIVLVFALMIWGSNFLYKRVKDGAESSKGWGIKGVLFVVGIAIVAIGARGGIQYKPLSVADSAKNGQGENMAVVLNTSFSIILTIQSPGMINFKRFSDEKLSRIINPERKTYGTGGFKGRNVALIILESFASEYVGFYNNGKGYTPFLDSLFNESYVFLRNKSNGLKSIDALPGIFAGIPTVSNTPYALSPYSSNKLYALPHRLNELGYSTSFYHGGENGTMAFDAFCGVVGIQKYYGLNEYPNPEKDYNGAWGIHDGAYLSYWADQLNKEQKPFFSALFTLSSHHPYVYPENLQGRFPEGDLAVHETIGYTDYALKEFFRKASKMDWFENTIFVITADHPAQSRDPFYLSPVNKHRVPLAFYDPQGGLKRKSTKLSQHCDIGPSIIHLLDDTCTMVTWGRNLFNENGGSTFNKWKSSFIYENNLNVSVFDTSGLLGYYESGDSLLKKNLLDKAPHYPKKGDVPSVGFGYIQSISQRIINNQLTPKSE